MLVVHSRSRASSACIEYANGSVGIATTSTPQSSSSTSVAGAPSPNYSAPTTPAFPRARLRLRDGGTQDPNATFDDDCYYTEGAYYYVETADDQE